MAVTETNRLRYRSIVLARHFKTMFFFFPERWRARLHRSWWQAMFLGPGDKPHLAGQLVLADLREFATGQPLFSADPLTMARRAGRREVFERIINYLNLDEAAVQQLMQLDDGL